MTTHHAGSSNPVALAQATSGRFFPVAISGAGPVGLAVALGLARAGVRSVVFEKKTQLDLHSRATLILPRPLEIFRQWEVLDRLLASGNRVPHVRLREPGNDHEILHVNFTKLAERFQTARPHRRVTLVRTLDALFGLGQSAGAMTHRFSMLDVPYEQSRLLPGRTKGLGHRLPDVITDDGERIYPKMPAGAILWAGDQTHLRALAADLDLPLVNGDVAALTRLFDRDHYVALIRPDHIVGAIADRTKPDHAQFAAALGRQQATRSAW
jgi:hypothetical protein